MYKTIQTYQANIDQFMEEGIIKRILFFNVVNVKDNTAEPNIYKDGGDIVKYSMQLIDEPDEII